MTTIAITGGTVQLPNTFAVYMYSPFPVIVEAEGLASVKMYVYCPSTGRGHTEKRSLHDGRAEFDLSRIAQLLAPDVDDVFRMNLSQDGEACPYVSLDIYVNSAAGDVLTSLKLWGVYGAMDALDERFGPQRRRIFVNYPQTLQIWKDQASEEMLITGDYITGDFYPLLCLHPSAPMTEMDLPLHLGEAGGQDLRAALRSGKTANVDVSCAFGGIDTLEEQGHYSLELVPDLTPLGTGTYLRWLHRDGTFGYWCFMNGALRTDAGQRSAFRRHINGNPAEPQGGIYRNGAKQDFRTARQMSLGTKCETLDEFEYLCSLASSPVVERMVIVPVEERLVSGDDLALLDGNGLQLMVARGDIRWQRVNVMPGSYARSVRRNTPSLQDFEIIIELPERNTVTL